MPTQMLSQAEIVRRWGPLLPGFEPAPPGHPIAANLPAGSVTDDTEQAALLARLLVKGHGTVDPHILAAALTEWERDMAERGSLDLLGPSTKRAVAAILAGTPPDQAGAAGATNGAAMRIAPVGIAVPLDSAAPSHHGLSILVDHVVMASEVTHNTGIALAGAAAVAAAVSAGVSGATTAEATAAELIYTLVGTSLATQESVPAAFAVLAAVPADPWRAARLAASLGGDCDTIAAMAGAIAGACHGAGSFPPEAIAVIDAQGLGLAALAGELLALRDRPGRQVR